jgi:hypothetical protein
MKKSICHVTGQPLAFKDGFHFNVNVEHDANGDHRYVGDAGDDLRDLRSEVSKYNKENKDNDAERYTYRVGLQGRLGKNNPKAQLYRNSSNTRISVKHAAYVGVYIWRHEKGLYDKPPKRSEHVTKSNTKGIYNSSNGCYNESTTTNTTIRITL